MFEISFWVRLCLSNGSKADKSPTIRMERWVCRKFQLFVIILVVDNDLRLTNRSCSKWSFWCSKLFFENFHLTNEDEFKSRKRITLLNTNSDPPNIEFQAHYHRPSTDVTRLASAHGLSVKTNNFSLPTRRNCVFSADKKLNELTERISSAKTEYYAH